MSTVHLSTPFTADKIDDVNAVIRGVSVITSGLIARGHDLEVDDITIEQMQRCADAKGQVPVKVDHKSGAAAVCGFLTNFRREENKLKADWFLLESHPQKAQILEVARRMPRGVGLSASFVTPEKTTGGKARCEELISVDYVTLPAANPNGMFAARSAREETLSKFDKTRRAVSAAGRGAQVGAVGGLAARLLLRRRRINSDVSATTGAAIGALAAGAYQWRRDSRRDLAARVATILLHGDSLRRVINATRDGVSVPIPGEDEAGTAVRIAKKPLVRRAAIRAAKIGVGAAAGYYTGKRYGAKAGALTGAIGGLLFSNSDVRRTVRLAVAHSKKVTSL